MKIILLFILTVVCILLEYDKIEYFLPNKKYMFDNISKPYIWIYIDKPITGYTNICLKSIYRHNKHKFDIRIINRNNLVAYNFEKSDICNNTNNIKKKLLYNYGGIWIPPNTLCMNSLDILYKNLAEDKLLIFKQNTKILGVKPKCKYILNYKNINMLPRDHSQLVHSIFDINNVVFQRRLFSNLHTININNYKNEYLIPINYEYISKNKNILWINNLKELDIINSNLLITKFL